MTKLIPHLFTSLAIALLLSACTTPNGQGPWRQPGAPVIIDPPVQQQPYEKPHVVINEDPNIVRPGHKPQAPVVQDRYPKVNVAILLPLSGARANIGQSMLQGAQLALFEIGYDNFNLMPRDTQGSSAGAAAAAKAAINDGAQIILGPLFANSVRAVKPVASARNINVIAFSTDWTLADNSTFLMGFMPFTQVERVAKYALSKGMNNFGLIAPKDTYGNAVANHFNSVVSSHGGDIEKSIRYASGDTNVINQIESWKLDGNESPNMQAVFMPASGSTADMIGSALSYNNLMPGNVRRLGTGLWDDPRIASQPNIQGGWFAAPSPQMRRQFESKYSDTYGSRPVRIATLAYDATALAGVLAKNGFSRGNAPDFTYRGITNPNGFAGTDGVFRFKQNGIVERQLSVLEIRNGNFVEIDPASRRF